ncbi:MAG: helix-turn-helix domain-containing protein [Firmicutes bacterium]|nr:helix-turn-helix domain-containing protein [Bacillota bacterium]
MDGKLIRKVALFIIDNHTVEEACAEFNLSRSTILKYCKLVRTKGIYFHPLVAELLNEAMNKNLEEGRIKGGKSGHIEHIFTDEEAYEFAFEILEQNKTIREIAIEHNSNSGTIYNSIMRLNDKDLLEKIQEHYNSRGSECKR